MDDEEFDSGRTYLRTLRRLVDSQARLIGGNMAQDFASAFGVNPQQTQVIMANLVTITSDLQSVTHSLVNLVKGSTMDHANVAAQIGLNMPIVNWLLGHASAAQALVTDVEAFGNASGIPAKWVALKKIGDDLIPIVSDFPVELTTTIPTTAQGVAAAVDTHSTIYGKIGDGHIAAGLANLISVISQNLPAILNIITTLGPMIGLPAKA